MTKAEDQPRFADSSDSPEICITATHTAPELEPASLLHADRTSFWATAWANHASSVIELQLNSPIPLAGLFLTPQQYEGQKIEHNDRPKSFSLFLGTEKAAMTPVYSHAAISYADYNDCSSKWIPLGQAMTQYLRLELHEPTGRHPDGLQRIALSGITLQVDPLPRQVAESDSATVQVLSDVFRRRRSLPDSLAYFHPRRGLPYASQKLLAGLPTRIAFVGGSITEMSGWCDAVMHFIRSAFPTHSSLSFLRAGIPSFDSSAHAFRLQDDIFSQGNIDLLIFESAVNDQCNGRTTDEILLSYEGIIRQAYAHNPLIDLLVLYFIDDDKIAEYAHAGRSHIIDTEDSVAAYYGLDAIDLSQYVNRCLTEGIFTWDMFGGLHPGPLGHQIYTARIAEFLSACWAAADSLPSQDQCAALPPLCYSNSYCFGKRVDAIQALTTGKLQLQGFHIDSCWNPHDGVASRADFIDVPMLVGDMPGQRFKFSFCGSVLKLFIASGPKSGSIRFRIDNAPWETRSLFSAWSEGLHLPWIIALQDNLSPDAHLAEIELLPSLDPSKSTTCVIRYFLINAS